MSIDIARWPCHLRQFSKIGTLGSPTRSNYDALELDDSHEDFGRDTGSAVWPDFSMLKAQMNTSLSLHFMTFLRVRSRSLKWVNLDKSRKWDEERPVRGICTSSDPSSLRIVRSFLKSTFCDQQCQLPEDFETKKSIKHQHRVCRYLVLPIAISYVDDAHIWNA